MDNNILSTIRTAKGFNRSVTLLVILALLGLMLERVIYYTLNDNGVIEAENPVEKIQRMAPQQARLLGLPKATDYKPAPLSPETRFAHSVQDIKEKLAFMDVDYRKTSVDQLASEIKDIRQTLLSLDKDVRTDFAKTAEHILQHQLPAVIQQRQDDAVAHYEKNFSIMMDKLAAVDNATTPEAKKARLEEAKDYLSRQQFKRSQQAFDPNNLPFNSVKPNRDNKPRIHEKDFAAAGLFNNPQQKLAALGDFTFDALPGATDPAYLAETDEVVITQAIRNQAQALNYDPVQIYHWVLNNIEWLPTWGSIQDSDITLGSKKGNAMDIASLLIALLRASQIPARYVHGTIDVPEAKFRNWAGGFTSIEAAMDFASSGGIPITGILGGGQFTTVRMEHVWVEAAIDYAPSRGARNIDADSWVQMDGSYKQYEILQGLDVAQIAGIDGAALAQSFVDSGTVNEAEGWVSGFDPTVLQNAQQQAQTALQDYITNNMQNPTVGDVIGGRRTIITQNPVLPSSLQHNIIVTGKRYGKLPDALKIRIQISIDFDILGTPINAITLPWASVNNQKITISFKPATVDDENALLSYLPDTNINDISQIPGSWPAYLINVIPELKINDQIVLQGRIATLGSEIEMGFNVIGSKPSGKFFSSKIIAGSFLSLTTIGGSVSKAKVSLLKNNVDSTQAILMSSDEAAIGLLDKEDLLGDMAYAGSLGYFVLKAFIEKLAGDMQGNVFSTLPSSGTYGYVPQVSYFFGIPASLTSGGVEMDLDNLSFASANTDNNTPSNVNYNRFVGLLSSALEHVVPEQMHGEVGNSTQGVSAVKLLSLASQQGQKIYTITYDNSQSIFPELSVSSDVVTEIKNAVNAGNQVVVHEGEITVGNWSGVGYLIIDQETGSGAYKIGGGLNGGALEFVTTEVGQLTTLIGLVGTFAKVAKWVEVFGSVFGPIADGLKAISDAFEIASACANHPGVSELLVGLFIAAQSFVIGLTAVFIVATTVMSFALLFIINYMISQFMDIVKRITIALCKAYR